MPRFLQDLSTYGIGIFTPTILASALGKEADHVRSKIGAVATAFLFPILLVSIGTRFLLYGPIVASLLGAVVTWMFRMETTGVNLDRIGEAASEPLSSSRRAVA